LSLGYTGSLSQKYQLDSNKIYGQYINSQGRTVPAIEVDLYLYSTNTRIDFTITDDIGKWEFNNVAAGD